MEGVVVAIYDVGGTHFVDYFARKPVAFTSNGSIILRVQFVVKI